MDKKRKTKNIIVTRIWNDLCDRKGFDLRGLDKETQRDILDSWGVILDEELKNFFTVENP